MKLARITSLLILSLIIAVACSTKSVKQDSDLPEGIKEQSEKEYIEPGKFYETCIELNSGQVLNYSFNSSIDVDFNIHYHSDEGRKYAIKKNQITSFKGELVCDEMDFYSKKQKNFCMIWSNFNENAARLKLKYYITSSPAPEASK